MHRVTQSIFPAIEKGDLPALEALLDTDPGLVHARRADPALYHWTTVQFAAARGKLDSCRLLVASGARATSHQWNPVRIRDQFHLGLDRSRISTDFHG